MRASAQAGAPDAACFHAQQAAEKYLKAYLTDRDREVIHTHVEIDPAFSQLADAATLLTPFAVEARYDAEFGQQGRCWRQPNSLRIASLS